MNAMSEIPRTTPTMQDRTVAGEVGSPLLGEGFAQTEDESEHNQYPFAGAVKRRMYG